jgi:hypothetical protein
MLRYSQVMGTKQQTVVSSCYAIGSRVDERMVCCRAHDSGQGRFHVVTGFIPHWLQQRVPQRICSCNKEACLIAQYSAIRHSITHTLNDIPNTQTVSDSRHYYITSLYHTTLILSRCVNNYRKSLDLQSDLLDSLTKFIDRS